MECRPRISNCCAATVFSYAATHVKNWLRTHNHYAGVARRLPILQRHILVHIRGCPFWYSYKGNLYFCISISFNRQLFVVTFRAQIQDSSFSCHRNSCVWTFNGNLTIFVLALDGRVALQCMVDCQGDIRTQFDHVFIINVGCVNIFNHFGKISISRDRMHNRLRHGARRRQRQHTDRYAQRLPNFPVHSFLPFLRFIVFLYIAYKIDTDIITHRHSFFNLFYSVLHESV